MTVAIAIETTEGIVLGADSTSTLRLQVPGHPQPQVGQLFNSAQKIFEIGPHNRHFTPGSDFSGGIATFGDARFGPMSIRALVNDFYCHHAGLMRSDDDLPTQFLAYAKARWDELKNAGRVAATEPLPDTGYFIAAVPKGSTVCRGGLVALRAEKVEPLGLCTVRIGGMQETALRIIEGCDPHLKTALLAAKVDPAVLNDAIGKTRLPLYLDGMPLRDVVDFVHFLVYSTVKLHRYRGAAAMVGGPIEIAVLTADRGFRWILHKPLSESIGVSQTPYQM